MTTEIWAEASRFCRDPFALRALSLLERASKGKNPHFRKACLSRALEEVSVVENKEEKAFLTGLHLGICEVANFLEAAETS